MSEDFISFLDIPLPPPLQHQCQNCSQSFSEENDLKVHQSVHNSDLTCLACSKKFSGLCYKQFVVIYVELIYRPPEFEKAFKNSFN